MFVGEERCLITLTRLHLTMAELGGGMTIDKAGAEARGGYVLTLSRRSMLVLLLLCIRQVQMIG
jgi:hypothetical protein